MSVGEVVANWSHEDWLEVAEQSSFASIRHLVGKLILAPSGAKGLPGLLGALAEVDIQSLPQSKSIDFAHLGRMVTTLHSTKPEVTSAFLGRLSTVEVRSMAERVTTDETA